MYIFGTFIVDMFQVYAIIQVSDADDSETGNTQKIPTTTISRKKIGTLERQKKGDPKHGKGW